MSAEAKKMVVGFNHNIKPHRTVFLNRIGGCGDATFIRTAFFGYGNFHATDFCNSFA